MISKYQIVHFYQKVKLSLINHNFHYNGLDKNVEPGNTTFELNCFKLLRRFRMKTRHIVTFLGMTALAVLIVTACSLDGGGGGGGR
jgi:hypothetical protein